MAAKVSETLGKLQLQPEDAAIAAVALEYATTMDRAAAIAAAAAKIPYSEDTEEELRKLRSRVSAQAVVSDLGPKLLAALDALQATPKSRATAGKPAPAGKTSKLTALRAAAS